MVLESVSDRQIVRRVRSGDCEVLEALHARCAPGVREFCFTLTGDELAAERAADAAFADACRRLAAQQISAADFRTVLYEEARVAALAELSFVSTEEANSEIRPPRELDFDLLRAELEARRPEVARDPHRRLKERTRLAPRTAVVAVLVMALFFDVVAVGLNKLLPDANDRPAVASEPRERGERPGATLAVRGVASEVSETRASDRKTKQHRSGAVAPRRDATPQAQEQSEPAPAPAAEDAAAPSHSQPSPKQTEPKPVVKLPSKGDPALQVDLPPVQVNASPEGIEAKAGPIDVIVAPKQTCITSICLGDK